MQLYPVWFHYLITICSGLLIGSFVNVLVARLPHDVSIIRPRSRCPECQAMIHWYDNIPVFSYIFLRGHCRHCGKTISVRYPIIELLTMLLFIAAYVRFGWSTLLIIRDWPFLAALVAITFIDLEHRIIPDVLSLGGIALGLVTSFFMPSGFWVVAISGAALGFGSFFLLAWAYEKVTGRIGMGGGDIKLLGMLGAFLGPQGVIASILISSILGSLVGIGWALARREKDIMKISIPYGPFLVIGGLYYYLLGDILWFQFMTPT